MERVSAKTRVTGEESGMLGLYGVENGGREDSRAARRAEIVEDVCEELALVVPVAMEVERTRAGLMFM